MSADNWAVCPQCKLRGQYEVCEKDASVAESYGKIPAEEYMQALRDAAEFRKDLDTKLDTLREDYGIGITEDGEFYVSYRGCCDKCGLLHEFKSKEKLTLTLAKPSPGKDAKNG